MTPQEQKNLLSGISQFVREELAPLKARIAELEREQCEWKYCGQWEEGQQYFKNNFVTFGGSLWHANVTTTNRPCTDDPVSWSICAKRGRDAARSLSTNMR